MGDEAVKKIIAGIGLGGLVIGLFSSLRYIDNKILSRNIEDNKKLNRYYQLLGQWLLNKTEDYDISLYLEKEGIFRIAVYGMGLMGDLLVKDLKNKKIVYIIDKNADVLPVNTLGEIPVIRPENILEQEPVDAIIVTACYYFNEISSILQEIGIHKSIRVISLEDLIYHE